MKSVTVVGLAAFVLATAASANEPASTSTILARCDEVAASPIDGNRPAGVPGVDTEKLNPKVAIPACEAAAKVAPTDARIAYQLGRAYAAAKKAEPARLRYEQAHAAGYAMATNNLAVLYLCGTGGGRIDRPRGMALLNKAAEGGAAIAMYSLGWVAEYGIGRPRDYALAYRWFERAAAAGDARATASIGYYYEFGRVVRKDGAEAARWYEKAIALGHEGARAKLVALQARERLAAAPRKSRRSELLQ